MAQAKEKTVKQKGAKETPLMAQYNRVKAQHPDALLLFRVGDFYETFGQDAITAAKVLNICLLYTSPSPRDQRGSRMPSSA